MISDFSFESPILFQNGSAHPWPVKDRPTGLQLPVAIPDPLLNLRGVPANLKATIEHFAPLQLTWVIEADGGSGGARGTAVLETDSATGAVWALSVLQRASTGRHRHNDGGSYGECVITLAGELDDVLDDGTAVRLRSGAVMFHAGKTVHEATADCYWAGIYHQPRGCTPMI
jgi:hypothetical protein